MRRISIFWGIVLLLVTAGTGAPPQYRIEVLTMGTDNLKGCDLNDSGQVLCINPLWNNVYIYDHGNFLSQTLLPVDPASTLPNVLGGFNNQGQIVGYSQLADASKKAVKWVNGTSIQLPDNGCYGAKAIDINNQGQIVGTMDGKACLWDGDDYTFWTMAPSALNDAGVVVGYTRPSYSYVNHGAIWQNGVVNQFLSGYENINLGSSATDINNLGQVVGAMETIDGRESAFLWKNGIKTDLGKISTQWETNTKALSINDADEIVGYSGTLAFYWSEATGMLDLNDLIIEDNGLNFYLGKAICINNAGQILCKGDYEHAFDYYLLTPTPEPACLLLMGLGVAFVSRKKSR